MVAYSPQIHQRPFPNRRRGVGAQSCLRESAIALHDANGDVLIVGAIPLATQNRWVVLGTPEEIIARLNWLQSVDVENVLFAAPGASVAHLRAFAG